MRFQILLHYSDKALKLEYEKKEYRDAAYEKIRKLFASRRENKIFEDLRDGSMIKINDVIYIQKVNKIDR